LSFRSFSFFALIFAFAGNCPMICEKGSLDWKRQKKKKKKKKKKIERIFVYLFLLCSIARLLFVMIIFVHIVHGLIIVV
jgi:hypothetical protein